MCMPFEIDALSFVDASAVICYCCQWVSSATWLSMGINFGVTASCASMLQANFKQSLLHSLLCCK